MITFPFDTKDTLHRMGGTITRVHRIAHEVAKPLQGYSNDTWYFVCTVQWDDGTKSETANVSPSSLVYREGSREEVDSLSYAMMDYLRENGEWCERSSGHEGWYAHVRPVAKKRKR